MRRHEESNRSGVGRPGRLEGVAQTRLDVMPGRSIERVSVPLHRRPQSPLALDPVKVEASDIAHPVAVDVWIETGRHADQTRPFGPFGLCLEPRAGVAPLRAERAHRVGDVRIVPGAALEAVVTSRDRADWTDVHQVAGNKRVHAFLLEGRDLAAVAAVDDVDLRVAVDVLHEAHAAG